MRNLALKLVVNAVALWVAARVIDGVVLSADPIDVAWVVLVFGLVNAVIRPIVALLSLPALLLSLGLFTFVINAAMLGLVAWLTVGLAVDGFVSALLGSIVVSLVSFALSVVLHRR